MSSQGSCRMLTLRKVVSVNRRTSRICCCKIRSIKHGETVRPASIFSVMLLAVIVDQGLFGQWSKVSVVPFWTFSRPSLCTPLIINRQHRYCLERTTRAQQPRFMVVQLMLLLRTASSHGCSPSLDCRASRGIGFVADGRLGN